MSYPRRPATAFRSLAAAGLAWAVACLAGCRRAEPPGPPEGAGMPGAHLAPSAPAAEQADPSAPVAHVDNVAITQGELDAAVDRMLAMLSGQVPPSELGRLRAQAASRVLDQLIIRRLLLNAVSASGIEVDREEILARRREIEESLPEGVQLADLLAREGMTGAALDEGIGEDLMIGKLLDRRTAALAPVTEAQMREYYDGNPDDFRVEEPVRARHILIRVDEDASDDQRGDLREQAERIRRRLADGADFAELAGQFSDCPSKVRGGDLGRFTRGQMVPAFEEAAFTHPLNEIGPLVETRYGYHILQVTEREEPRTLAFDDVKEQLSEGLATERRQEAIRDYIDELRQRAEIRYAGDGDAQSDGPPQHPASCPCCRSAE